MIGRRIFSRLPFANGLLAHVKPLSHLALSPAEALAERDDASGVPLLKRDCAFGPAMEWLTLFAMGS